MDTLPEPVEPPSLRRCAWGVFVAGVLILSAAAAPTITFHDAGEFALSALRGGVPHPPGAPSWCLAAGAFAAVARWVAPHAEPARWTNLFSAWMGAATLGMGGLLAARWTWRLTGHASSALGALLASAGFLLCSEAFVEQSATTEQYTFLTALLAGALLLADRLARTAGPGRVVAAALGATIGLAIANHLTQVILIPVALWAAWRGRAGLGRLGWLAGGLALGLSTFLSVPLRSRANPILDVGDVETVGDLMWALRRDMWARRPMSSAPPELVPEWLQSYDLPGELGPVCLALALAGVALLLTRRARAPLLCALWVSVSYGGGLLLGHLAQSGIERYYIRDYGVSDWHLPQYLMVALLGGIGLGAVGLRLPERGRAATAAAGLCLLLWGGAQALTRHSLRGFDAGERIARMTLAPLAPDALIVTSGDNLGGILPYYAYASPKGREMGFPGRWIAATFDSPLWRLKDGADLAAERTALLASLERAHRRQPFNPPTLSAAQAASAPIYVEFLRADTQAAKYLLPAGFLFEIGSGPTSDAAVRERETLTHARHPEMFRPGTGREPRLERLAMAQLHWHRAVYFEQRGMDDLTAEAYRLACSYRPQNGRLWASCGVALRRVGDLGGAAKAFAEALATEPGLPGIRADLGVTLALAGDRGSGREMIVEEQARFPRSRQAREALAWLERLPAIP